MKIKIKCKENKQESCKVLNEDLGSCEIEEDGIVVWRCHNFEGCEEVEDVD